MCNPRFTLALTVAFLFCGLASLPPGVAHAAPKYTLKIASLAPEGSVWANRFNEFTREVTAKSNGEIAFKVYSGGVMGDDRSMYRKIRAGQLQGGGFTMTGIGEIVPDFRVLGVPFLFDSYLEVDRAWAKLWPLLQQSFAEKGLKLVATTEVGFIYTMSTKPLTTVNDLRQAKCWVPEGDPISKTYLEKLGIVPMPLSIPDVLTSLQTGMIDTVFNAFYGSIVLQWFTRTKYITDIPFGYSYGALVLDDRAFRKLPASHQRLIEQAAVNNFSNLVNDTRKSNSDALRVLKENGISLVSATPEAIAALRANRQRTVDALVGTAFSKRIYETLINELSAYRSAPTRTQP
ncbi:MAG: TRAP transporter substrate-binding protein DctP [Desulfobulbaceae bacterium]|nr:TRAP transporter substrate-binding protein DctP [Desulfobulbaceae bacterium]